MCVENRVLRGHAPKKRILLTDNKRSRLAVKGNVSGRKGMEWISTLCTPDTTLRCHRQLVAQKKDHSERRNRVGRPPARKEVAELIVRFATENRSSGYRRIQGALANLRHEISKSTVARTLKANSLQFAPVRKKRTPWKEFLKAHGDKLSAIDFTNVELWMPRGLNTYYALFAIKLKSRRVGFAGLTTSPCDA